LADFSIRPIQALSARLNEFENFQKTQTIRSVKRVRYRHLIDFAADFNAPSIHVTKSRVWSLGQFYHFLTLHRIVSENIATGLLYPKIEKTVPRFLTSEEYTRLLGYFTDRADSPMGLRTLVIIMLLSVLGLRTATPQKWTAAHIQTQKTHLPAHCAGYIPHCSRLSQYR
jgi:site-specific recombinase XerD